MDLQSLENNYILIIPNVLKEKILLKINEESKLLNIKIMNLDEFKKKYYFDYKVESIYFIMKEYGFDYDFSLDIINNLYYISDNDYSYDKLNFLVKIKKRLLANNLLVFDNIFRKYVTKQKICIYGYDYIPNFFKGLFKELNVQIITNSEKEYRHNVYEFQNINEELEFVVSKICELYTNGIPLSKIKIINPSSEYNVYIKRYFKLFNLPINFNTNYLISTNMVANFFNLLTSDITETLENLKMTIDISDSLAITEYNQIIGICNKYNWCNDFREIKDVLIYEFQNEKIDIPQIENAINVVPLNDNIFDDDEVVFLMGLNQNNYPATYKDDDFLTDNIKTKLNLETTNIKNKISYQTLVTKLKNTKNMYISYKLKTPFATYYKSPIIEEEYLNITTALKDKMHYSKLNDELRLAIVLDNYLKYGEHNSDLEVLLGNYPNISYQTFDNQYNKITEQNFRDYLKNRLSLSYSSINNFYRCGFRYYLENILKIQVASNDFTLFIGNLFHYVLSQMNNDNFNFDGCFDSYVSSNYEIISHKEKFFIKKLKLELKFIIETIKEQKSYTSFNESLFEEVVKIDLSRDNYNITFKGIIDKIMYKKDLDKTLVSIIDYKTGNPNLNLNNIIYGLDMQLCIYAYLSSQMKMFSNPILVGIYLQKVLNSEVNIDKSKDYLTIKKDNLKLQGYSINNEAILKEFDNTYQNSRLIKSLKMGKNGFYAYSKVFDQDMLNSLLSIVDKNIKQARDNIIKRDFFINPKKIGIDNYIGCENCKYKEICYMKEDNIVNLKEYKNLEFLKGDVDEMD